MNCYPCRVHPFANQDISKASVERMVNKICHFFNLDYEDVISKSRSTNLVFTRVMITDIILHFPFYRMSLNEIGNLLGGRDHSSIIHYKKLIRNMMDTDDIFRLQYESLHYHLFGDLRYFKYCKNEYE